MPVPHAGRETPFLHRVFGFLIQPQPDRAYNANVANPAGGVNNDRQHYISLELGLSRLLGVLRVRVVNRAWRAHPIPGAIRASTETSAATGADAWAATGSIPSSVILSNSAVTTGPVRGHYRIRRRQITQLIRLRQLQIWRPRPGRANLQLHFSGPPNC